MADRPGRLPEGFGRQIFKMTNQTAYAGRAVAAGLVFHMSLQSIPAGLHPDGQFALGQSVVDRILFRFLPGPDGRFQIQGKMKERIPALLPEAFS